MADPKEETSPLFQKFLAAIRDLAMIDLETVEFEPTRNLILDSRAILKRYEDTKNGKLARPENKPEVHILFEGRSLCLMDGVPAEWPPGHSWVHVDGAIGATCRLCLNASWLAKLPRGP